MNSQEITLWKEYAETLARENQAKDVERQTLNKQICILTQQNIRLTRDKSCQKTNIKNQEEYIHALQNKVRQNDRSVYQIYQRIKHLQQQKKKSQQKARRQIKNMQEKIIKNELHEPVPMSPQSSFQIIISQIQNIKNIFCKQKCDKKQLFKKNHELEQRVKNIEYILGMPSNPHCYLENSKKSEVTETLSYITLKPGKQTRRKSIDSGSKRYQQSQISFKQSQRSDGRKTNETPVRGLRLSKSGSEQNVETSVKLPILRMSRNRNNRRRINLTQRENIENVQRYANMQKNILISGEYRANKIQNCDIDRKF